MEHVTVLFLPEGSIMVTSTSPTPAPGQQGWGCHVVTLPRCVAEQKPDVCCASPTCSVNVKIGGLVGDVPGRFQAGTLGRGLAGVPLSHSDLHLKGTL